MKKSLLALTLLFSIHSFSQDYIPMLQEGNSWSVVQFAQFSTYTQNVNIDSTVIINDVTYHKVIVDDYETGCLIREENGIVYFLINESTNEEIIWYDFTLEVGDTHEVIYDFPCVSFLSYFNTAYVLAVTFEEIAGQERKVIQFTSGPDGVNAEETWIEGIGSLSGFDPFGQGYDNGTQLACFTKDTIQTKFNGFEECDFFILSVDEIILNQISFTPNPVSERATLTIPQEIKSAGITVYDVNGKQLHEENISEENTTIDFSALQSGMYFYQIYSENELIATKKLIIR